ncbi:hypothetical protein [Clostridium tarantellae]|uniref:Uncharacterized protein n=1 Tax=Clostridium tarantellae TaxID=39493 RepID=A0A6I1MMX9_9CLOT|nr:hypothetical protein [Clostridium tarantellae]MPQ43602.1 hypothetical protein [Clostridium tarantellae]
MYRVYDIDDLKLPDIIDDTVYEEDVIPPEEISTGVENPSVPLPDPDIMTNVNPMNSTNNNQIKISADNNYLKISNFGNFNAIFNLVYNFNLNNKAATFTFAPYNTEYLEIPKNVNSIYVSIKAIDPILNELLIFDKIITNPKNIYFIIQGNLQAPRVLEETIKF